MCSVVLFEHAERLFFCENTSERNYPIGGASLYGFILFNELARRSGSEDLGILAHLVADGRLSPRIDLEVSWTHIADAVQSLLERRITGKAVLTL